MFRKGLRFQENPLIAEHLAVLIKANRLMSEGKLLDAGRLYADLAEAMQRSNYLRRAANLYTRAAHAFVEGNNEQEALGYARTALELFSQHKMPRRQRKFFTNITRRMTDKGMQASSQVLQKEYGTQITAQPAELQQEIHKPRGLLPTSCPKCGGAVASDEVDWVDDRTARCEYCGTLIRTEN